MERWQREQAKWVVYEVEKRRLERLDLTHEEYISELAKAIERLKL